MSKSILLSMLCFCACLVACSDSSESVVGGMTFPLERLTGNWEDVNRQNKFYEEWTLLDEAHLTGKGYVLSGIDTVFIERLEIKQEEDDLYYIVSLSGSQEEAVRFKMSRVGKDEIVFENPSHDFPKSITYRMISNIEMSVFLNGKENGKFGEERFSFVRK